MSTGDEKSSDVSSSITLETTSNPPKHRQSSSIFGDADCGEPLLAQHLVIDFTPIEEVDNDYVQRKCCAFWDFINSHTELDHMKALPDPDIYVNLSETSTSNEYSEQSKPDIVSIPIDNEKTAVSMLEFVEDKGLINRIFEAKIPQSHCSLGVREYQNEKALKSPTRAVASARKKKQSASACSCAICKPQCSTKDRQSPVSSSPEVLTLCRKLGEWDRDHPKVMDPPDHPPALSHCVMQRIT